MAIESKGIKYEEEFILNSRGLKLFTCRWAPANQEPKALIFMCHGYAMECSISMEGTGTRLARAGYAVHGIDYEGHGKSSGLPGFVPSFDNVVHDCSQHFTRVCGVVALRVHRKQPDFYDGAILVAPMCKIQEEMRPHPVIVTILSKLCRFIPTWRIVPTQDVVDSAIKETKRRVEVRANPYCYKGRPRLQTAYQLLMASVEMEKRLNEISLPFIVVHGGDDKVSDPSVSKLLYESASSTDKTFKLYPGMWHALTSGEPEENMDLVFSDIIEWLVKRAVNESSRLEREQKHDHDLKK
ncbi:Serine aminopeptidase, S33 [Dillenia turbinata]|uniref:Serine aminopeptidase, S33 n=1 Tax=Dillenia turbinata TaxID=194707 RepID=A0AAN8ZCL4_9MAGN